MPRMDSLEIGELTDTIFYIILALLEPKHGYLIMKSIEQLPNNFSIGPASMYTTIKKLLAAELIEHYDDDDEKRKAYIATEKGIEVLRKEIERRKEMVKYAEQLFKQNKEGYHESEN